MANILKRFSDIMSANINALLDKAEDPEKMIDEYLRQLQSDFGKVKAETAAVMAESSRVKRQLDECNQEIQKMQRYAEKAVAAGNDMDARQFLEKKQQLSQNQENLLKSYESASENAEKMKEMHSKLLKDMNDLMARKDAIKAKAAIAKTQNTLNKAGAGVTGAKDTMSAFSRMEERVDRMLDEANAMAELNASADKDDIEDLTKKYDESGGSDSVDDELAALKAQMNQ
jgi:phage shock protein A